MNHKTQFPQPEGASPPARNTFPRREAACPQSRFFAPFNFVVALTGLLFLLLASPAVRAQQSPEGCTGSAIGISLFTSAADVHVGDTIQYSVTVFNGTPGGGLVACDAVNIRAFVVTPDGVSHEVDLVRTTLLSGQSDYYENVASYVARAEDILPGGTLRATASTEADILQGETPSEGGAFQGVNTVVSEPCISLTVVCVPGVGEDGSIVFNGTVTNCGNNTLVGITVVNSVNNGFFEVVFPENLLEGQTLPFTGTWIPLDPCNSAIATLVASGRDQFTTFPRTVTSSVEVSCQNVLTSGIEVTKVCPVTPPAPGALLVFSGSVRNTGNIELRDIVVVNNQPGANTPVFTLASLAPGAVANFTGSYVTPDDCSVSDTLTANAFSICDVPVSDTASATCPIRTTPGIQVTTACPTTPVLPGQLLNYTGTVRNTGDVTLNNIIVVSDRPGANTTVFTIATLAPGATANFAGSHIVPTDTCPVNATITATATDACESRTVTNSTISTCVVTTAPSIETTVLCPTTPGTAGAPIVLTGTVRNTGNVTVSNVVVTHDQGAPNNVVFSVATLAPGAVANFTATLASPSDACSLVAGMTARASDACSDVVVSNTASVTCALNTTPSIVITQLCPVAPAVPGGSVNYTGTVRNSGDVTLNNIIVVNSLTGGTPVLTLASLAPGASAGFSGSYLVPVGCDSVSVSTVTAESFCGVGVSGNVSTTCPVLTTPSISVTTECPTNPVLPGQVLNYTGVVSNTGNVTLSNVVVVSDLPVANTVVFTVASLNAGASVNFTGSHVVPMDVCLVNAMIRASGSDICTDVEVANTTLTSCEVSTAPAIQVSVVCPELPSAAGGPITLTGTVRNTGNVTLNNVVLTHMQGVPNNVVLTLATLAPGAVETFTTTFNTAVDSCALEATITARGNDKCTSDVVSHSATVNCPLIATPSIAITQVCPTVAVIPGSVIAFTGTVRNTGNITLTNVVVVNTRYRTGPIITIPSIAPGVTVPFKGFYLAPVDCDTSTTSTVTGRSVCGVAVTDNVTTLCPVLFLPAIQVTQTCPPVNVVSGQLLTFTGTVKNFGNTILTNIVVYNNRSGETPIFTIASLDPGVAVNFTGSYMTHEDCCVDTSTVTATGLSCEGVLVSDTSTKTCVMATAPAIAITKVCVPGTLRPGDLMEYSGTVSNTGNITLLNVNVANTHPGINTHIVGPLILTPGETANYTVSYIIPDDFCGDDTVTATGTDLCTGLAISSSASTLCPVETPAPSIAVTKNCPVMPTEPGDEYVFTGTVSNTGKVTLVNVTVVNSAPSAGTHIIGPITLAPGETKTYTGSYLLLEECCDIVDMVTARGESICTGQVATATASQACPVNTTPRISITQACPTQPVPIGGRYIYTATLTNTGDSVLTNVVVLSNHPNADTLVFGPIEMSAGEVKTFTGSYTVTANTIASAGVLTARATDLCSQEVVSATANCAGGPQAPIMTITSLFKVGNVVTVIWTSVEGSSYVVERATGIVNPVWTPISDPVVATGVHSSASVEAGEEPQYFYRVVRQ